MKAIKRTIAMTVATAVAACLLAVPALGVERKGEREPIDADAATTSDGRDPTAGTGSEGSYMPNRTWIRPDADGGWATLTDSQRGNTVGAGGESVLNGDVVAGAVNGVISGKHNGRPGTFELTEDWSYTDRWFDPQDVSTIRIYRVDMNKFTHPSVDGISRTGEDVTDRFDIAISGTTATATAKPEYLDLLGQRTTAMQFSMIVPYTVNFDEIADLEQDFGSIGDAWKTNSLNTCGTSARPIANMGSMQWEDQPLWQTNMPSLCVVRPAFVKTVTAVDSGTDINGMNVLAGQQLDYTLKLRVDKATAYTLNQLSFSDSYSEHVSPDQDSLTVTLGDKTLPKEFYSVQWDDADNRVTVTMDAEWLSGWKHDEDHLITVGFHATVRQDVEAGTTVNNNAVVTVNESAIDSNTVTNTVVGIGEPFKDVTIGVGDDSADGMSLYQEQAFLYRLDSSMLPANRAYSAVNEWRVDDDYDETADRYAGQWAVYAAADLHTPDGTVIAAKGTRIAGSSYDSSPLGGDLFTLDMRDASFTIAATQRYLDLVSADNAHEHGWRAYVRFTRIRAGETINTFTQILDGREYQSNTVTTSTPERSPSVGVESFDEASGPETGDRDVPDDALALTDERTTLVFRITNTGDVPLTALELSTETVAGDGEIIDWQYPDDWQTRVLKPGAYVDVTGILTGVTVLHTDRAIVTAAPVIDCAPDDDPFNGTSSNGGTDRICTDTAITSAPDDWNGYVPQVELPDTGSTVTAAMTTGAGLLLVGLGLLVLSVKWHES